MVRVLCATLMAICLAAPSHAAGHLFVVAKAKQVLQVFDPDTGELQFEIKGTGAPHMVAVSSDGRFAYTGDADGIKNTVSVIDVAKRAKTAELNIKPHLRPHGLAITKDGSRLFVTSAPTRAVVEIQLPALTLGKAYRFFADSVENLALTPDESVLFASSSFDGNIMVIDLKKNEYERAIISGDSPEGLSVTPDGKELWVANRVSQTIAVIDIAERRRVASLQCIGNPMHVYFTPDGSEALVTGAVADRLIVFDRAKRAEIARFVVGDFPVAMALDDTGATGYVTCSVDNDVAVVDIAARKVLRRIPVAGDPEGIAYSSK